MNEHFQLQRPHVSDMMTTGSDLKQVQGNKLPAVCLDVMETVETLFRQNH